MGAINERQMDDILKGRKKITQEFGDKPERLSMGKNARAQAEDSEEDYYQKTHHHFSDHENPRHDLEMK